MSKIQNCYYRIFQFLFNISARCLAWRRPILISGPDCIRKLPELLRNCKSQKTLIVTGPHIRKSLFPQIEDVLHLSHIPFAVFSEVEANPSAETCCKIRDFFRTEGCDSIVALGGGSPMDAAKGAAAILARPNKSPVSLSGLLKVGKPIVPFIAIPTTAGSGSETTIAAVITDEKTHHKAAIMDLHLIPKYALLDPKLTVSLSPGTTARTGMDALTHAVEAYLCWTYNTKESIHCAENAVKLIFTYLEKACQDGTDLEAREKLQLASYDAGFAFTRAGVGNVHAIAHTLGGVYQTPHGLANAVILPIVLEDYGKAVYPKLSKLADLVGLGGENAEDKAKNFIKEIYAMNRRMGIEDHFAFIQDRDIDTMITWALKEANPVYPVPVIYDRKRCKAVLEKIREKKM